MIYDIVIIDDEMYGYMGFDDFRMYGGYLVKMFIKDIKEQGGHNLMFSFDNRFSIYKHVVNRRNDVENFIKKVLATKDYLDRLDYSRDSATENYFIELPHEN